MASFPALSSAELIAALQQLGFVVHVSHPGGVTLRRPSDLRAVTIEHEPVLQERTISIAMLVAGVSPEELTNALRANQKTTGSRELRRDDEPPDSKKQPA